MARTKQVARFIGASGSTASKPMNTGTMHISPYIQKSKPRKSKKRKDEAGNTDKTKNAVALPAENDATKTESEHGSEEDEDEEDSGSECQESEDCEAGEEEKKCEAGEDEKECADKEVVD